MKNTNADLSMINRKFALALSGGGKRAALFQCGGIMALAAFERLKDVSLVSAISGGSLAALALKRAFVVNLVKPSSGSDADIAWSVHEFLVYHIASHDFRTDALLGFKHLSTFLSSGEFRLTEAIAKQIIGHLKDVDLDKGGPATYLGARKLATKDLVGIPLTNQNAGLATAVAMALPGVFDAVPIEDFGAVVDGGLSDKTGLQLLSGLKWDHDIVLLDASQASSTQTQFRVNAIASLQLALEVDAEANRSTLIKELRNKLTLVSLRDGLIPGIDADCVEQLRNLRTDLDHFTPVETDSLIITGFIATCICFGDTPDQAHERLAKFAASSEGFKKSVTVLSRGLRSHGSVVVDMPEKGRILEFLKMGRENMLKELSSSHPYLRLSGIFNFVFTPMVFIGTIALLLLLLLMFGAFISRLTENSVASCIGVSVLIFGLLTATVLRKSSARALGLKRMIFLTLVAPLILAVAGAWHYALLLGRPSASISSVEYHLGFLGRLWEIVDLRQYTRPFSVKTLVQATLNTLLIFLLIINPIVIIPGLQSWLPSGESFAELRSVLTFQFFPNTAIVILIAERALVLTRRLKMSCHKFMKKNEHVTCPWTR